MDNLPRQTLRRIVAKYGKDIAGDARRCEALLNDLCVSRRREINVLVNAIEERIPLDLLAAANSLPLELLLARLEKRFEDQMGVTPEAARWAIESWALALGIATEREIEEREQKQSKPTSAKAETIQSLESETKAANSSVSNINRVNPNPLPKTQTPVPSPRTAPPASAQQSKTPQPLPPVYLPTGNQPSVQTPPPNLPARPPNPSAVSKGGFSLFRGCLLMIFLLAVTSIVLFFGVPYAIEVMRETQRERNNEPPRFPVR